MQKEDGFTLDIFINWLKHLNGSVDERFKNADIFYKGIKQYTKEIIRQYEYIENSGRLHETNYLSEYYCEGSDLFNKTMDYLNKTYWRLRSITEELDRTFFEHPTEIETEDRPNDQEYRIETEGDDESSIYYQGTHYEDNDASFDFDPDLGPRYIESTELEKTFEKIYRECNK